MTMSNLLLWMLFLGVFMASAFSAWFPSIFRKGSSDTDKCPIPRNLLSILTAERLVDKTIEKALDFLNNSLICPPVTDKSKTEHTEKLRFHFYYGTKTTDSHVVPIPEATALLNKSEWNKSLPVTIFIGGWKKSPKSNNYSMSVVQAYYKAKVCNLLLLGWDYTSKKDYRFATAMVEPIGKATAAGLHAMMKAGASVTSCVGHSLGAHLCGAVGRNLHGELHHIAALDPAGPLFYETMYKCAHPVVSTDAKYVVAVHSDWNFLGGNEFVGGVDFVLNGGYRVQPGCTAFDTFKKSCIPFCSHHVPLHMWCNAIENPGSVLGRQCTSWNSFLAGKCQNNSVLNMADITNDTGLYFLRTSSEMPYGAGKDGI